MGGDYLRLQQFAVINNAIKRDSLIDKVKQVGAHMKKEVEKAVQGK